MVDYLAFFGVLIATGGLIYAGLSFRRLGKTEELRTFESINKEIGRSLKEYNLLRDKSPSPTEKEDHATNVQYLFIDFFVEVNWLCYLFRHGQIKDKALINAYRDQIITWYEDLFIKRMNKERIDNKVSFMDFKHLYPQMKLEIQKEIAFAKKHPHITKLKTLIQLIVWKLKRRRYY